MAKSGYHTKSYEFEQVKNMIGRRVSKTSWKPFASGNTINTVKSIVQHKHLPDELAFQFEEDDSQVECRRCILVS